MNDTDMQGALDSFGGEALELLADMDARLLRLEETPDEPEELNGLFRAVHTLKGTAGLFGMQALVGFTHQVETVLDLLREGSIAHSPELSSVLFGCKDQMQELLALALQDRPLPAAVTARDAELRLRLRLGTFTPDAATPPTTPAASTTASQASDTLWRIHAQFGAATFQDGFDPLSTLGYLRRLGEVLSLHTEVAAVDDFATADPEVCRLGFDITLRSAATRAQIDSAFKFVQDSCRLEITRQDQGQDKGQAPQQLRKRPTPTPTPNLHPRPRRCAPRTRAWCACRPTSSTSSSTWSASW